MAEPRDPSEAGPRRAARAVLADRYAAVVANAPAGANGLGVAVRADDGWTWDHESEHDMVSASTIKVLVLCAVLSLVDQGRVGLDDRVALPPVEERVGGDGSLHLLPSVDALPLLELLRLMIAVSDNAATNAVIDHAGLLNGSTADLAAVLAAVPTRHTQLRRRLMDLDAASRGLQNETCAADLADLLGALRQGRLLAPKSTRVAIEILRSQQVRNGLPAYLPPDVLVAAKPGDLPGLRAEVALLERGDRWAVVSVAADGLISDGVDRGTALLPVFAALGELTATLL